MPLLNKNDVKELEEYSLFLETSPYSNTTQSIFWAKLKWEWNYEGVFVKRDGEIVAAVTVLIKKIGPFSMMYAPKGPVCDISDLSLLKELKLEIDKLAKMKKAFLFTCDPEVSFNQDIIDAFVSLGFTAKNRGCSKDELIQPRFNMMLNIKDKTEDELMASFNEKTRYNIRYAKRKGVEVRYSRSDEDIKKFHEISEITAIRDKITCRSLQYFKVMRDVFPEQYLRVYTAEHEGEALSGAIAICYGKKMWYIYGASSNNKRNLMPNHLMQWEMIKWGLENGCEVYDFGGVFELSKENGLYRFKEGFCREEGLMELVGEFEFIYNKTLYNLFTKAVPKIRGIRRKIAIRKQSK